LLALLWQDPAPSVPKPPEPADMPVQLKSEHYDLSSLTDEAKAKELLDFMEIVHATYLNLLKPDDPETVDSKRFTVVLYRNKDEYDASGAPKGSAAYYNGKRLVGYYDEFAMWGFFAHEGMHQFTDITSRAFRNFPMWFSEGIADCIGNSIVKNGRLYMCLKGGPLARRRLHRIQAALRDGKAYSLKTLLTLPRDKFMGDAKLCYAQSWSFCHFLMCFPEHGNPHAQIPNGRFRQCLAVYYELIRGGNTQHQRAWDDAFKGYTVEELEEAWKKYILDYDGPKLHGFEGRTLTAEECAALGLGEKEGGVLIEKFDTEFKSAFEEDGFKVGDKILKVKGDPLPRKAAYKELLDFLGDWPLKRKLKIDFARGEKNERQEISIAWKK
ncbi:MAG TPA: DUF1570 domain-containing protein, partial [Planctomycetota bacterium]|nr:DUF1570 domain-containing protein [Planctomycetota bacterium]